MTTTDAAPAIRVRGLTRSYGDLHVLRGVDLEVARGSIVALLGSNGAGKTTLIRILATLLKPDAGTAEVEGVDVATRPAEVREAISLTGQFAAVDEVLTGPGEPRARGPAAAPRRPGRDRGRAAATASPSRRRAAGGSGRTPAACAAGSTSR